MAKVIQGWYMDESDEDQRLPHHREPKELSFDRLNELGVLSWSLDADNYETDEELKKVRAKRGYTCVDFCQVCPAKMPNYDQKIKVFFRRTSSHDEEIRYCVDGSGYFDVRDENEKWIRVWVKKGGMIVLPAGHNPLQLSTLFDYLNRMVWGCYQVTYMLMYLTKANTLNVRDLVPQL
ncbi:hypothetical protein MKX01_012087 [Papaver californicum]|nr:hypothetical protein MKX01_012087 [Papaver californicum]